MRFACLVVSSLVSSVALAAPPKPVRKPAPPSLDASQLDSFVDAIVADKRGDYDAAVREYQRVGRDIPASVYNLADLYLRMEEYERALEMYKKYLALAPDAPDRGAVQKQIDQLAKRPMTIVVDGDDLDAVVFIDGKPAGPSPLLRQLPDGEHVIDRIGPTTFESERVTAKPLGHRHIRGYRERTGNVVMSTTSRNSGSWTDGDKFFRMHDRFTLPPGRVDTYLFAPGRACSPVSFEVPPDGLVYVFIEAPRDMPRGECTPIKVTAQKVVFPEAKK